MTHLDAHTIHPEPANTRGGRTAGILIGAGSILMIGFMAVHPTPHAHDLASLVSELARLTVQNAIVHGSLIAVFAVIMLGMFGLAERLGLAQTTVRAGLLAYALGGVFLMGAAIVNGFIVPGLIPANAAEDPSLPDKLRPLLALCRVVNSTLSQFGVVALCASTILWSIPLLRRGRRAVGILGAVCGVLPLGALAAGYLPMNLHGFGAFVLLQGIWYFAAAYLLIRGRI